MKKTICVILVMTVLAICAGCEAVPGEAVVRPAEGSAPVETAAVSGTEEQLALIEANTALWMKDGYWYAVTDLDENGRLELISAITEGSGIFTTGDIFEVSADGTGLKLCTHPEVEGYTLPEIIVSRANSYVVDGLRRYVFIDSARSGYAEMMDAKCELTFKDGAYDFRTLGFEYITIDGMNVTITNRDGAGNDISASDYYWLENTVYDGIEKEVTYFGWFTNDGSAPLAQQLQESADSFMTTLCPPASAYEASNEPMLVFAEDMMDGSGFTKVQCGESGIWDFAPAGTEGEPWSVYILDEEFTDAERYIPQAYPLALEGRGSLYINEGQWIYIYCPYNAWTGEVPPERCAFSWGMHR